MRNDTERPFSLTLTQSDLRLQVVRLTGHEALNQPYRFEVELISLAPPIAPDTLLGQPVFLHLEDECGIHAIVHSVVISTPAPRRAGYRLTLGPYLQFLENGPQRRIFHRLDVTQILQCLLKDPAVPDHSYRFELPHGQYPSRPFCIQYEESDLALLHRLCEEEGIHYHFEHHPQGHVLVFAEDAGSFPTQPVALGFRAQADSQPTVTRLYQRHRSTPPAPPLVCNDRGPRSADNHAANQPVESDEPQRLHSDPALAYRFQAGRRGLERLRCRQRQIDGDGNHRALRSGEVVQLRDHPVSSFNDQWLITEIEHHGQQVSILEASAGDTLATRDYANRFSAIPWSTAFRPALKHPRPELVGHHPGFLSGPAGQPVEPDEQGRILVSLWHPDEQGIRVPLARLRLNETPSLMAGSEVLVSFLDGDPDRPVVCPGVLCAVPADIEATQQSAPEPVPAQNKDARLLFEWLLNPPTS